MKNKIFCTLCAAFFVTLSFSQTRFNVQTIAPTVNSQGSIIKVGCQYVAIAYITSSTWIHARGVKWIKSSDYALYPQLLDYNWHRYIYPLPLDSGIFLTSSQDRYSIYPSDKTLQYEPDVPLTRFQPGTKYKFRAFLFHTLSGIKYVDYGNIVEFTTPDTPPVSNNSICDGKPTVNLCSVSTYTISGAEANTNGQQFTYQWESKQVNGNWSPIQGATSATCTITLNYTSKTTVSYRRIVTVNTYTNTSNQVDITYLPPVPTPSFSFGVTDANNPVISVPSFSVSPYTITWQKTSGGNTSTATSFVSTDPGYKLTIDKTNSTVYAYNVLLSYEGCSSQSFTVAIPRVTNNKISGDPTFPAGTTSVTNCFSSGSTNSNYQIYGSALAGGITGQTFNYQWQSQSGSGAWSNIVIGANDQNYSVSISGITSSTTAKFRRIVWQSGINLSDTSAVFAVTFIPPPGVPVFSYTVTNNIPSVAATLTNGNNYTYQWQIKNAGSSDFTSVTTNTASATTATLTLNNTVSDLLAQYQVSIIPTGCTSATSFTTQITPISGKLISLTSTTFTNQPIAATSCGTVTGITFYGEAASGGFPGVPVMYKWQKQKKGDLTWNYITNATSQNYAFTLNAVAAPDSLYRRIAYQGNLSDSVVSNVIQMIYKPRITLGWDDSATMANGTFSVTVSPATYQWQICNNTSPALTFTNITSNGTSQSLSQVNTLTNYNSFYRIQVTPTGCTTALTSDTVQMPEMEVQIGSQTWALRNARIRIDKRTNTNFPVLSNASPVKASYIPNNDYGNLYNASAAYNINCPDGWRVADSTDWMVLLSAYNYTMNGTAKTNGTLKTAATYDSLQYGALNLMETGITHWAPWPASTAIGTNLSGFTILGGGDWDLVNLKIVNLKSKTRFWTYSERNGIITYYTIAMDYDKMGAVVLVKTGPDLNTGRSVRFIKKN